MPYPEIAPIDGKGVENALKTSVRKPDGSPYAAFDQVQEFIASVRKERDASAATRVFATEIKGDVDEHSARINELEGRLAALEAQPVTRFP